MRVGVYFCRCGGIVSEKVDPAAVRGRWEAQGEPGYFKEVDLACGEDGIAFMASDIAAENPDRVVVAACSPREHESTFRNVMTRAGKNPFLMQLANIREMVGWVTTDPARAAEKTWEQIQGALMRVKAQRPLNVRHEDVSTHVLVVGGGPAGIRAALACAQAGRKVVLVERDAILGGMPLRYEEVFPRLECGACALEPFIAEVLQGKDAGNIEVLLQSEVTAVKGSFGNFEVTIRRRARHVNLDRCIGCGECVTACPASMPNRFNVGLNQRKAMDLVYFGGLPNAPYLDPAACTRFTSGSDCTACQAACPVENTVDLREEDREETRHVGGVVLAIGAALYNPDAIPLLGHGRVPGVYTNLEAERLFSGTGPSEGMPLGVDGKPPQRVAVVHCAGSLDTQHKEYCSGTCCLAAFKLNRLFLRKIPGATVTHHHRSLVASGKDEAMLMHQAMGDSHTRLVPYASLSDLEVRQGADGRPVVVQNGKEEACDMVILMLPTVASRSTAGVARSFETGTDRHGFFQALNPLVDPTASRTRGVMVAGACTEPMALGRAMTQGLAAAGGLLAALVPGRQLEIEAIHAVVDESRCSGCRTCVGVCPYRAIDFDPVKHVARVSPALCTGCGTCAATCPSGVITSLHFSDAQIFAELEGLLS
jgi:heterodisulfide reductase subunit A